ncbi:golgin subfamily A member 5 [Lepeophtheirus salmonis]|nr:golgin subfamily A member 5-like isoform X2 [Lepeophtheirus salmonis]
MSTWINDIAGKAEYLLNTIDQNASRVLESDFEPEFRKKEALNNDDLEQLEISQTSSIQETTNFYEITEDGTSHGDVTNGSIDKESYKKEVIDREPEELVELKTRLRDLELEIQSRNRAWLDVQEEIKDLKAENEELSKSQEDYKLKAQKILSEKDKYIMELKKEREGKRNDSHQGDESLKIPLQFVERKEIIYITSERDLIREEANRLANRLKTTLMEVNDLENRVDKQNILYEKASDEYQKKISIEKEKTKEAELELKKKLEDIHFLEEAYRREEASYLQSIKLRDLEIENMRKKLCGEEVHHGKPMPSDAEKRIKELASALMQKQTLIGSLLSEKSSLCLQMEKLEKEFKRRESGSSSNKLIHRYPQSQHVRDYVVSPLDTGVTRKVKSAYSSLYSFSIWIGFLLRQYPLLRIGVMVYGIVLHLWVFTMLFQSVPDMN